MSIDKLGTRLPAAESEKEFLDIKAAALVKVQGRKSATEWFAPFKGAVINADECTLSPLNDCPGVFEIIDHTLQNCVGYTTDSDVIKHPLNER